jgi:peroxiredoxin
MRRASGGPSEACRKAGAYGGALLVTALMLFSPNVLQAQSTAPHWTTREAPIAKNIAALRSLADDVRPRATQLLAVQIRALPASANKLALAYSLANLSTEGDQGQDTVQAVATTLGQALRQHPVAEVANQPAEQYVELAMLATYEHAHVKLDSPQFEQAMKQLQLDDLRRGRANFTLTSLDGDKWTLRDLRGKVVLVNFWATWCPPCRKEMPDLDALYKKFRDQGFVVLAISDEQPEAVRSFLAKHKVAYPVLLDPGDLIHKRFGVDGIPKSYLYDRDGKLVAEAMDMRTRDQFLAMLAKAGLIPQHPTVKESLLKLPARAKHSL